MIWKLHIGVRQQLSRDSPSVEKRYTQLSNHDMNYSYPQIVMQEIPDEITLALSISGCPVRCSGCHSPFTWNPFYGQLMNKISLFKLLEKYEGMISCVLFYGGEWEKETLNDLLDEIRQRGLLTALYTGLDTVDDEIATRLDFVKLGPWIEALGGLDSRNTNQRLIDLRSGECLNHHFQKQPSLSEPVRLAV